MPGSTQRRPVQPPASDLGPRRVAAFSGTDVVLVAALREGDRRAMAELVARYGSYVECVLARILGVDGELPDLLHDVFVTALDRIDALRNRRC